MLLKSLWILLVVGVQSLLAQTNCGNIQLQLAPDYSYATGSSNGGNAYTFTEGGNTLAQGPLTQLALFHYDGSAGSTSGIVPGKSTGVTYVTGKLGQALSIATGGQLSYPASGHIGFTEGTIELWIAPTKDGTDPIYSAYDHTLFRYTASNGDQLVFSESAKSPSFYAGTTVNNTFTGTGNIQIASLKANVWHHVAFTYSKGQSRLRLYLDGVMVSENKVAFSMPAADGSSFTIDSDPYGHASAFLVDELRISADEKTATQIQNDATRTTPFADNEVFLSLTGVPSGQLNYQVTLSGNSVPCSATTAFAAIPITKLNPQSNLLPAGATSVDLSFETLQASSCAYSVGTQLPFASMTAIANGQKTTVHEGTIQGISPNPTVLNTVYLRCDSNPDFVETLQYRAVGVPGGAFPRIGSIWAGEYILTTKPDQAAKIQVYFGPVGMPSNDATALRAKNPNVLILQNVNAEEGPGIPLPSSYMLRDTNGNSIEDWPGAFLLNLTKPEVASYLAQYAFDTYITGANLAFDGLFWDNFHTTIPNVFYDYKGLAHQIDANGDGIPDDQQTLNTAWANGLYSLIAAFNKLAPNAYTAGHLSQRPPSSLSLANFNGESFTFDAPSVREGTISFGTTMDAYNAWFASGRQPGIATIQSAPPTQIAYGYGYNPLQQVTAGTLQFSQSDYPYMRFGLATALMNDGFSIFDFGDTGAAVNWWYDEYDFNLGQPLGPAVAIDTLAAQENLVRNAGFELPFSTDWAFHVDATQGAAATWERTASISADGSYSAHISVTAPLLANNVQVWQGGIHLTAGAGYALSFWARSSNSRNMGVSVLKDGGDFHTYGLANQATLGADWRQYVLKFTALETVSDGRINLYFGEQAGEVWLDAFALQLLPDGVDIYRRDFSNGSVLLNGTDARQTIPVSSGFTRFTGSQAPLWQYIVDDNVAAFSADSSWQSVTYDSGTTGTGSYAPPFYHAWNGKAHIQSAGGTPAQWDLDIPEDGQYTIRAWLAAAPGAKSWTGNAVYEIVSAGKVVASAPIDQTVAVSGDGWHDIATVSLTAAGAPFLRVHNAGTGSVIADAVSVSSAALFNDGSPASQVRLGAFDGILLKRQQPVSAPTSHVDAVVNAATFQAGIASGSFVTITGRGFATSARTWMASDFTGGNLPVSLDGVSVTINGKQAFVEYISPTQINVIAPDDDTIGQVSVQVTTPLGAGYPGTVLKQKASPAFFPYISGTTNYVVAVHLDGTLVGPAGPSSRPATPGEVIEIYGNGFGATNPALPSAQLVAQAAQLVLPPTVSVGGINAEVQWGGLVASGLYQLNVQVPDVATGDQVIQTGISGFQSAGSVFLAVISQ